MIAALFRITAIGMMTLLTAPAAAEQPATPAVSGPNQHAAIRALNRKLQTVVPEFDTSGMTMTELVLGLAYKYQLPMGIECANAEPVHKPLSLRFKRRRLNEIITGVVQAVSGFQVDYDGGLVDIYRPEARADPLNPFNTVVHTYDVTNLDTDHADLKLFCSIVSAPCGTTGLVQVPDLKVTLHLRDKKVYEILNAIVSQNAKTVWTPRFPLPRKLEEPLTNFWLIYPLDRRYESAVVEDLQSSFPRAVTRARADADQDGVSQDLLCVVGAISQEAAWTASASLQRWNRINERQSLARVVNV